jgi:uncharacterized protein YciI
MKKTILPALLFMVTQLSAQTGVFTNSADIGNPEIRGSSVYDPKTKTYTLRGAGYNIWFNRDEFQYLYKKLSGNFILTANFRFSGNSGNMHRKMGWMIRESANEEAQSIETGIHGDGLIVLQWRLLRGAYMRDPEDEIFFPEKGLVQVVQLERNGNNVTMRVGNEGEPLRLVGTKQMPDMKDSVLAGLYVCSHDEKITEEVKVSNVSIRQLTKDTGAAAGYDKALADSLGADQYGMRSYVLAILKTGSAKIADKEKNNEIFRGHMNNIEKLVKEGKLSVAGPFGENPNEFEGLFILNVSTVDEAKALLDGDPTVTNKVFNVEYYPWYGSAALPMYLKDHKRIEKTPH